MFSLVGLVSSCHLSNRGLSPLSCLSSSSPLLLLLSGSFWSPVIPHLFPEWRTFKPQERIAALSPAYWGCSCSLAPTFGGLQCPSGIRSAAQEPRDYSLLFEHVSELTHGDVSQDTRGEIKGKVRGLQGMEVHEYQCVCIFLFFWAAKPKPSNAKGPFLVRLCFSSLKWLEVLMSKLSMWFYSVQHAQISLSCGEISLL